MSRPRGERLSEVEFEQYRALSRLLRSRAAVARVLGITSSSLDSAICSLNARALEKLREGMARAWPAPGGDA